MVTSVVDAKDFSRQLEKVRKNIQILRDEVGPKATVQAGNKVLASAVTITVKRVASDLEPPKGEGGRNPVKQKHIRQRVRTRNMSIKRPEGWMHAWVQPITAISLGFTGKNKSFTGKIQRSTQTRDPRRPHRTKSGKISRAEPKAGGVRVGTMFFQEAFVQRVRKNKTVHVFRRRQFRTWEKGSWGWKSGNNPRKRAPFNLLKYDVSKPFRKHFEPALLESIDKNFQKQFDAALAHGINTRLKKVD